MTQVNYSWSITTFQKYYSNIRMSHTVFESSLTFALLPTILKKKLVRIFFHTHYYFVAKLNLKLELCTYIYNFHYLSHSFQNLSKENTFCSKNKQNHIQCQENRKVWCSKSTTLFSNNELILKMYHHFCC